HADRLSSELQLDQAGKELVKQRLESLLPTGLLLSPQPLLDRISKRSDEIESGQISAVGIPTKDRPQLLKQTLSSFAACSRTYGREIEFFVADQTTDPKTRADNLQALTEIKSETGCAISYLGSSQKAELAKMLADRTGHPLEWIRFALLNDENCPKAYGANR